MGSLMSPLAGDTGFRSAMDRIAGMFSNTGLSIGNAVNTIFSGNSCFETRTHKKTHMKKNKNANNFL